MIKNFIKCLIEDNEGSEWDVFIVVKYPFTEIEPDESAKHLFVCDRYADHMGGELILTKNQLRTDYELKNPIYVETDVEHLNKILYEYFVDV